MARPITHRYLDPLDAVWIAAAEGVGLRVARGADVYAATDGAGTLRIGAPGTLDPDDCLAQMIFHELCHSLVEGPGSFGLEDWGLDNGTGRHLRREQACLRVQAALSEPWGLRWVLAPTTDHRAFYDALPDDPLAPRDEQSSVLARLALGRADEPPWAPRLGRALEATARIVEAARSVTPAPDSLYARAEPISSRHPLGSFVARDPGARCDQCAWRWRGGRGRPVERCRQAGDARVEPTWPACDRFEPEPEVDCRRCGACCREAYGAVIVSPEEPVVRRHPDLIVLDGRTLLLRRDGARCAALEGGRAPGEPYRCAIYDDRPTPCSELERAGPHCLTARRRVGLSR